MKIFIFRIARFIIRSRKRPFFKKSSSENEKLTGEQRILVEFVVSEKNARERENARMRMLETERKRARFEEENV